MPTPKLRLHDRSNADKREFLLAHRNTPDAAWTPKRRRPGETREQFIDRLLGDGGEGP